MEDILNKVFNGSKLKWILNLVNQYEIKDMYLYSESQIYLTIVSQTGKVEVYLYLFFWSLVVIVKNKW